MWNRPGWDEIFMFQAISCAVRSTCHNRRVGAIIVKDKRVIASGYSGAASGIPSCLERGDCYYKFLAWQEYKQNGGDFEKIKERFKIYTLAVHAESNAFVQVSVNETRGATLYVTNFPCPRCAQDVVIAGKMQAVRVWKDYLSNPALTIDEKRASERKLIEAGISVQYIHLSKERILEIAQFMADEVGVRTNYQFEGK